MVPLSRIVPAKTFEPFSFETGIDSPVMLASFMLPSPDMTVPSTGIFAPVLTKRMSPTSTSSTGTSSKLPSSICFKALSGAISVGSFIAERVLLSVRSSKKAPNKKRKVTTADSSKFLIKNAPATATVTKTSMLTTLTFKAWYAWIAIGAAPKTEAITKAQIASSSFLKASALVKPITIKTALKKVM
ncbi:MAG: hypothetical protein BWY62_01406 [Firmicutes bacterium ADurb.Bin356]|nr:MAG: hypothetical protein BWY62_01406 [Firmicutes bacterium ADurb.Bin356]